MSEKQPTVLDFTNGQYKFGFKGDVVKKAIVNRIDTQRTAYANLLNKVRTITENLDPDAVVTLLVSFHSPSKNSDVQHLEMLATKANEHLIEMEYLTRCLKGMVDGSIYVLTPEEMKRFGL